jgi:carboxylesterase
MDNQQPYIKNPHLVGDPFLWPAGRVGVMLIHGYTATTAEVRLLAQELYAKGYTISAPLLPGHGTSPEQANKYSWKDWVETAERAYQHLATRCDHVFVGGESTGALLALFLGSGHPEISGLLIYAPALRLNLTSLDKLRLYLLAPFIPYRAKSKSDDDLLWKGYTVYPLRGAVQLLRLQNQVHPRLPNIRRPILIVQGRLDMTVHPRAPEIVYQKVNSAIKELHWMEESTHCVILDRELDQVTTLTLNFIERILGLPG